MLQILSSFCFIFLRIFFDVASVDTEKNNGDDLQGLPAGEDDRHHIEDHIEDRIED